MSQRFETESERKAIPNYKVVRGEAGKATDHDQRQGFREALCRWFLDKGNSYPWRETKDPYAILVSEVMLRQTRIGSVLKGRYYERFMERFPTVKELAAADEGELLKSWEGLGYYRRVRMLQEAARWIVEEREGEFPQDYEDILRLPGVGRYTAGAVFSFAYDQPAAIVDGNIARVLLRLMDCKKPVDGAGMAQAWKWAELLMDTERPRVYNSALMELGQKICRPGRPDCEQCPVAAWCRAKEPQDLPRRKSRVKMTEQQEQVIYVRRNGKILLRKLGKGRREGMWRLPTRKEFGEHLLQEIYVITRYRITMNVHSPKGRVRAAATECWIGRQEYEKLSIPPADRRAIDALEEKTCK